jgi:flagellar hook-basal body complex protein FliE
MAIDALSGARIYAQAAKAMEQAGGADGGDKVDFGGLVQNAVQNVQNAAATAETAGMQVAAGRGDLVDVVTAIAAAETSLQTVMAVRDQVIQAYQEILRMPI